MDWLLQMLAVLGFMATVAGIDYFCVRKWWPDTMFGSTAFQVIGLIIVSVMFLAFIYYMKDEEPDKVAIFITLLFLAVFFIPPLIYVNRRFGEELHIVLLPIIGGIWLIIVAAIFYVILWFYEYLTK